MPAEKIDLERIDSSHLGAIGYNPHKLILAVQFAKTGVIFHYANVPVEVAAGFNGAESKGRYYSTAIRGRYPAQRMTGPCEKCNAEGWVGDVCDDCGTATFLEVPYVPKQPPVMGDRDDTV